MKKHWILGVAALTLVSAGVWAGRTSGPAAPKAAVTEYRTAPEMPDFTLTDIDGKTVKLSELRGKFVYLDFWASWCKPCMMEMPDARRLQKELADQDITWVFISLDQLDDKWRKAVKANKLTGIHLRGGDQLEYLKKEFDFNELPFYIWIGKDGKVLKHNAPRPSESGTARKIRKLASQ